MNNPLFTVVRHAALAATSRPWRHMLAAESAPGDPPADHVKAVAVINALPLCGLDLSDLDRNDACFIATASPLVVLKLLDEIERLDRALDQTMKEIDQQREMCDALAAGVAEHFNEFIGEHSNANCPWNAALEVLNLKPEFTHCTCGTATAKVAGQ